MKPSHIDGHNHVHCLPGIAEIISQVLCQYGIYKIRLPKDSSILVSVSDDTM